MEKVKGLIFIIRGHVIIIIFYSFFYFIIFIFFYSFLLSEGTSQDVPSESDTHEKVKGLIFAHNGRNIEKKGQELFSFLIFQRL